MSARQIVHNAHVVRRLEGLGAVSGYAATRRSLPLGGAGMTEFLMTSLYWLRMPLAPALAAVLAYRVFNFLLVAAPAVIARRQLDPLLHGWDERSPGQLR